MKRIHPAPDTEPSQGASSPPLLLLVLAGGLFWGSARQQPHLAAVRESRGLADAVAPANTPPLITFSTIMLGGFRGILADLLWLRATRLQDEGRYVELVQLADWITKLEPRTAGIWSFHAWNMAYNVCAVMSTPDERWQWVRNGIHLLRDEGLRYAPGEPRLYFELGWLYQHKIGTPIDPMHLYYQQRLAVEIEAVLPGGTLPGTPADAIAPDLRRTLGLDLATMRDLDGRFGALDWRLPEAHSLYWATCGLQRGGDSANTLCRRMAGHSLAALFFSGHLERDGTTPAFRRSPRLDLLEPVLAHYQRDVREHAWNGVSESFDRFLVGAIPLLRDAGRPADAQRLDALRASLDLH